jgi:hypothetical protein
MKSRIYYVGEKRAIAPFEPEGAFMGTGGVNMYEQRFPKTTSKSAKRSA